MFVDWTKTRQTKRQNKLITGKQTWWLSALTRLNEVTRCLHTPPCVCVFMSAPPRRDKILKRELLIYIWPVSRSCRRKAFKLKHAELDPLMDTEWNQTRHNNNSPAYLCCGHMTWFHDPPHTPTATHSINETSKPHSGVIDRSLMCVC